MTAAPAASVVIPVFNGEETLGDLLLTFQGVAAAENYRRDLNLDTATARVSQRSRMAR